MQCLTTLNDNLLCNLLEDPIEDFSASVVEVDRILNSGVIKMGTKNQYLG